ncbi:MAG: hypothetical protein NXI24_23190 [bacterium]|nr:hypothetical protein [bacterium]
MPLKGLSDTEKAIVHECLEATTEGPFFEEWEFETLFGLTREEVREVIDNFDQWERESEENMARNAINGALGNLLGFPHRKEKIWEQYISVSPEEIKRIFDLYRANQG